MPLRPGFQYPPDEELNVQEINISLPHLRSSAHHYYNYCKEQNYEYMLCKDETGDPRACLKLANEVTNCALEFFRKIKKNCKDEIDAHAKCLYMSSSDWGFEHCRKSQEVYDTCMLDKLNIPRARYAEPLEVKIIHSKRPKEIEPPAYYPDAPEPFQGFGTAHKGEPRWGYRNKYF